MVPVVRRRGAFARRYDRRVAPIDMLEHRRAWRVDECMFEVISRDTSATYTVELENGIPRCSCPAGSRGRPCYHAALILRRLERERRVS